MTHIMSNSLEQYVTNVLKKVQVISASSLHNVCMNFCKEKGIGLISLEEMLAFIQKIALVFDNGLCVLKSKCLF